MKKVLMSVAVIAVMAAAVACGNSNNSKKRATSLNKRRKLSRRKAGENYRALGDDSYFAVRLANVVADVPELRRVQRKFNVVDDGFDSISARARKGSILWIYGGARRRAVTLDWRRSVT